MLLLIFVLENTKIIKFIYIIFSKFDGYFLIKYLAQLGYCDPIIHKGKIISCNFTSHENGISITFMDSYLILPSSLKNLCKSFDVKDPKGIFPYNLYDINYSSKLVPDFKYFSNITIDQYNAYKDSFKDKIWNFKQEAIKYCELDCISLHQILTKFNSLIFNKFKLNIVNFPTLPSLAFAIFRSKYMKILNIYQLTFKIDKDIRQGYTGGSTDMFIPTNPIGTKIYGYDVNSLYASVMKNNPYPVGNPTYFEGNILVNNATENNCCKAFGFFYCKITAPENLLHPILQIHHNNRTVSPLGNWEGMYFSEELYNAEKYGYKFEILWGYTFDKDYIFKDYINDLYNIRLNYPKSDPMNLTAKLLLNSLYGRFGMHNNFNTLEFVNQGRFEKLTNNSNIKIENITQLGSKFLVSYNNGNKMDVDKELNNVNISIAAAVSAYARIHMSQFKNNPNFPNLYYTDTDSLYFDGPLSESFISQTELGKMKLEGIYDQALFLAPKVYALKNNNEEIIKIKGFNKDAIKNNKINLDILSILLTEDFKLTFNQNKWFRNLMDANIQILEQIYTLKVTNLKRNLVYKNNKLVGTKPLKIEL